LGSDRRRYCATWLQTARLRPQTALRNLVADLEPIAVDELPARQPRPRRQPPDLHVRRVRVVGRVLVAVLAQPGAHILLRARTPARAAVDQEVVSSHRLRRTRPGCPPSTLPARRRAVRAAPGTASS